MLALFKIVSHTADIGIDVEAGSLEALFIEAARGWKYVVLENAPTRAEEVRHISLKSDNLEDLLVQWLGELNYFLTVDFWVLHDVVRLTLTHRTENRWELTAEVSGETLDPERHYIYFDIKAITYHQLNIRKENGRYRTRIIFDI